MIVNKMSVLRKSKESSYNTLYNSLYNSAFMKFDEHIDSNSLFLLLRYSGYTTRISSRGLLRVLLSSTLVEDNIAIKS